ncbi:MAG: hypothetical protein KatS3mg010_0568 [Acidimicrobiia bacterium]|nr:MAG: hypothetical protein KatS3mg010_0568 [Acidimicrobiia bacterium]
MLDELDPARGVARRARRGRPPLRSAERADERVGDPGGYGAAAVPFDEDDPGRAVREPGTTKRGGSVRRHASAPSATADPAPAPRRGHRAHRRVGRARTPVPIRER